MEVLFSSPDGGRVQGTSTNTSLSDVTPPVAINTKNRTIFYYNTNDKYVYRRSLDANLNPEVITYYSKLNNVRYSIVLWCNTV